MFSIHRCIVQHGHPRDTRKGRQSALSVGTQVHTAPEAFGKVMSAVRPRMAVAYHFFKDFDTTGQVYERIRSTYDGPLSLAEDFMVRNVTGAAIITRMAIVEEATWSAPGAQPAMPPSLSDRDRFRERLGIDLEFSEFIVGAKWNVDDVLRPIYDEAGQVLAREFPYPGDDGGD